MKQLTTIALQSIITKRIIIIDTMIMVLCCILLGLAMGVNF